MSETNPWVTVIDPKLPTPPTEPTRSRSSRVAWAGPVVLRGAHGGAGVSTLARLLGVVETARPMGHGERVLLVCRSHASGLLAAQRVLAYLDELRAPQVHVAGLVINADAAGRTPRPLADLAQLVGGGAPQVWRLPWVESWRLAEVGTEIPRSVAHVLRDITDVLPGLVRTR